MVSGARFLSGENYDDTRCSICMTVAGFAHVTQHAAKILEGVISEYSNTANLGVSLYRLLLF